MLKAGTLQRPSACFACVRSMVSFMVSIGRMGSTRGALPSRNTERRKPAYTVAVEPSWIIDTLPSSTQTQLASAGRSTASVVPVTIARA